MAPLKRIVHVTSVHKPDDTRIYQRQVKSLARDGFEVVLIAPAPAEPLALNEPRLNVVLLKPASGKLARLFLLGPRTALTALRTPADLYHFHDPELIPWMLLLQLFGKRVVMDIHENYPAQVLGMSWIPRPLRAAVAAFTRGLVRIGVTLFAGTVVADDELRKAHETAGIRGRLAVVNNYPILNEALLAATFEPERYAVPRILFLGGVNKPRVAREFVTALDLLGEVPFEATVGGNTNDEPLLGELSKQTIWRRIQFVGRIPSSEITTQTLAATISCNLYSDAPNHHDIRSNRLFEAMAAGLAVVVSDFPNWRRFIEEHGCGIAVNPHDPADIAAGLGPLLRAPDRCREMGMRGRAAVLDRYNWKAQYAALKNLYTRIIQ